MAIVCNLSILSSRASASETWDPGRRDGRLPHLILGPGSRAVMGSVSRRPPRPALGRDDTRREMRGRAPHLASFRRRPLPFVIACPRTCSEGAREPIVGALDAGANQQQIFAGK